MDFLQLFMFPFSFLMKNLYQLFFSNYGVTLILFALLVKVILFPLSLKGKKSMIQMNMLQGKVKQIQTRYAKDREKQNLEIQALYEKENVSPMGGCVWSMLPMFILIPLYAVVRRPLRYLMGLNDTVIATVTATAVSAGVTLTKNYPEISIVSAFHDMPELLAQAQSAISEGTLFGMDFHFLGIDLSVVPALKFWENGVSWGTFGLFLIPILSAVFSFLSSRIMMKTNAMNQQGEQQENAMANNKMMMWMAPIMSLYIGYIMPASMGVYWIANSLFAVAQELLAARMLRKDYAAAAEARAAAAIAEKEEEKQKRREAMERKAQAIADSKNKKKKKDAETQEDKPKRDSAFIAVSGIGNRPYARGRAYDPNRFSPEGPTLYGAAPVEEVVPVEEAPALVEETLVEEVLVETPVVAEAAPVEAVETPADPWAEVETELDEIQTAVEEISDDGKA